MFEVTDCYAELRTAMRKPFRNLMARRQNGKAWGVSLVRTRQDEKKMPRDSPTVFRATTPPPPDNDSFKSSISWFFTTSWLTWFLYHIHESVHRNYVPPTGSSKSYTNLSKFSDVHLKIRIHIITYLQSTTSPDTASLDVFLQRWVATSARSDELLRPAAGRFRGGSCHRGESYRWSSNGWCLIPKGLLNGTVSHPFGTHWRVLLCF